MPRATMLPIPIVIAALPTGCTLDSSGLGGGGFGGSGGSGFDGGTAAGLALARDACRNRLKDEGKRVVRIEAADEVFGGSTARVMLQIQRDPFKINPERWRCQFSYATGQTSLTRV